MFPHENSLVPIFLWRDGTDRPEQVGTGVYVLLGERSYLFTAGHVTDLLEEGDLCIPTTHGIRAVAGGVASNNLPAGLPRQKDRVDIGYIRLDEEHNQEKHPHFEHLPRHHIDIEGRLEPGDFCAVGGYPISRGEHKDNALSTEAYSYVGIAADEGEYKRLGYDPRVHVLVKYHIKQGIFPEGDRVNPPHPRGLSGGGIFRLASSFPFKPQGEPRLLVAVMHTYLRRENYFVGTKIPVYLINLYQRYPTEVRSVSEA